MSTFEVIVYGNGDLFSQFFNAIVAAFGKGEGVNHFKALFHISILLAGCTVLFSFIMRRDLMTMVKWLGLFYVAVYILFLPESTIVITDRTNGDHFAVDHVPRGLAVLASYTSSIGDALTRDLEMNFTMPDYQPYHKHGMVFASRIMSAANQFQITDARFDANLKEFIHQCVFYDLLLKKYTMNDLTSAKNLWDFVTSHASPARAFIYDDVIQTCEKGAKELTKDWKEVIEHTAEIYGKRLYPNLEQDKAKEKILTDLPISYSYLTKLSETGSNLLKQNLMANAIQRGILSMGAKLNAPAALESYSYVRAQEQKRLTNKTLGDMAAYWLPLMKNTFEAIMYGSFIFVVLLSVFPFGFMILKNYIYTLIWIQIWAPLYAIINLIVSFYAQSSTIASIDGGISLGNLSSVLQVNSDISGLAGSLSLSVPFLAAGLIKLAMTMTHLAQTINGTTQSAAGSSATEAMTGNISLGNTSLNNHNAFNTQANHVDTSGRVSAGFLNTQLSGGSNLMMTPDGSLVMDMRNSMSNMWGSVNLAQRMAASYTHQAEASENAAFSNGKVYSEQSNVGMKTMLDLGQHFNNSRGGSYQWATSENATTVKALSENANLVKEFSKRFNVSEDQASNLLISAYTDSKISAGVKVSTPGFLPISGDVSLNKTAGVNSSSSQNHTTNKNNLYSEAENFIKNTNFSNNSDHIERVMKDHSFRLNNEEGKRFVDSATVSFDHAESARHDMQVNLNKAESARKMASLSQENSESININAGQHFIEWLVNQPGTSGQGRLGYAGAEAMRNDPNMMQHYADHYIRENKAIVEKDWHHGMAHTGKQIENHYTRQSQHIKNNDHILQQYNVQKLKMTEDAKKEGLGPNLMLDGSPVNQTEERLSNNKNKIEIERQDFEKTGEQDMAKAKEEQLKK